MNYEVGPVFPLQSSGCFSESRRNPTPDDIQPDDIQSVAYMHPENLSSNAPSVYTTPRQEKDGYRFRMAAIPACRQHNWKSDPVPFPVLVSILERRGDSSTANLSRNRFLKLSRHAGTGRVCPQSGRGVQVQEGNSVADLCKQGRLKYYWYCYCVSVCFSALFYGTLDQFMTRYPVVSNRPVPCCKSSSYCAVRDLHLETDGFSPPSTRDRINQGFPDIKSSRIFFGVSVTARTSQAGYRLTGLWHHTGTNAVVCCPIAVGFLPAGC